MVSIDMTYTALRNIAYVALVSRDIENEVITDLLSVVPQPVELFATQ